MKKIGRYVKLMGVFAKYSLMSALEYRINFVTGVSVEMGWMIIKLLYVAIIYKAGTNIGILTPDHILLFVGTYMLMTAAAGGEVLLRDAETGFCLSAAGTGGWCGDDCCWLAPGGASRGSGFYSRVSFFPGLRMPSDL